MGFSRGKAFPAVGSLRPALRGMEPGRGRWETRAVLLLLMAFLLFLRGPDELLRPQFWAEDGTLFFQEAYDLGFARTVMRPAGFYLGTLSRLTAGLALLFPLERAPLAFALIAFLARLVPLLYLMSRRSDPYLPTLGGKLAASLLYVALPNSSEVYQMSLTGTHFILAPAVCLVLLSSPPAGLAAWAADVIVLSLAALSGPFAVVLAPVAAWLAWRDRRRERRAWRWTAAAALSVGALLQGSILLRAGAVSAAGHGPTASLWKSLEIVSLNSVIRPLFGLGGVARLESELPAWVHLAALAVLAVLIAHALAARSRPLLLLLYLAGVTVLLTFLCYVDVTYLVSTGMGSRTFLAATMFMGFSALSLASVRATRGAGLVLVAVMCLGVGLDFFRPRRPDTHYPDQIAVFRSLPAGEVFHVQVLPRLFPPMKLEKRTRSGGTSPLSGLAEVQGEPSWDIEVLELIMIAGRYYIRVIGDVRDAGSSEPPGGVYLLIDGRLYPATTDSREEEPCWRGIPAKGRVTYRRYVPLWDVGAKHNVLSLVILTPDRKAAYAPTPPLEFRINP